VELVVVRNTCSRGGNGQVVIELTRELNDEGRLGRDRKLPGEDNGSPLRGLVLGERGRFMRQLALVLCGDELGTEKLDLKGVQGDLTCRLEKLSVDAERL
jgi:hypothetical protein